MQGNNVSFEPIGGISPSGKLPRRQLPGNTCEELKDALEPCRGGSLDLDTL